MENMKNDVRIYRVKRGIVRPLLTVYILVFACTRFHCKARII